MESRALRLPHDANGLDKMIAGDQGLEDIPGGITGSPLRGHSVEPPHEIFSPFENMPLEVLTEIFLACTPEIKFISIPPEHDWYPWALGRVCSHWRQVIWSTRSLWSHLSIWCAQEPVVKVVITLIFSRINGPFSITISSSRPQPILDLLLPYSHRIGSLTVACVESEYMQAFLALPSGSLDALRILNLRIGDCDGPSPTSHSSLKSAANLRGVSVTLPATTQGEVYLFALLLPWTQLTTLELDTILSPATAFRILRECHSLEHCTMRVGRATPSNTSCEAPLNHVHIRTLTLRLDENVDHGAFLRVFTLPAICVLSVQTSRLPLSHITHLIQRSACTIVTLTLKVESGTISQQCSDEIEPLFHALPGLECLVANFQIPHPLIVAIQEERILPQLREIYCKADPEGFRAFSSWLASFEEQGQTLPTNIDRVAIFCKGELGVEGIEYIRDTDDTYHMGEEFYVDEELSLSRENAIGGR